MAKDVSVHSPDSQSLLSRSLKKTVEESTYLLQHESRIRVERLREGGPLELKAHQGPAKGVLKPETLSSASKQGVRGEKKLGLHIPYRSTPLAINF